MRKQNHKFSIAVKPAFYVFLAVSILVFPLKWLTAWLVAAAFHECCHLAALILCRSDIQGIAISPAGMYIQTDVLGKKEVFCAIAGPLGGSLLLLLSQKFPRVAVCAFMQTVCNLIPVYPLDGGRVVRGVLGLILLNEHAERMTWIIGKCSVIVLAIAVIYTCFVYNLEILSVLMVLLLLLKTRVIKIPCKDQQL